MIVVIAGMHRSGTSMMARYFHHAGISMGEELYVETITNPYGHFEDMAFLALQRNELARAFGGQDYLVTEDFTPSPDFLRDAETLLRAKMGINKDKPWGWKDPRTTLFLEHWARLEPRIRVVALVREPRRVVDSLCARLRGYFSTSKQALFLRTYRHYNSKIRQFLDQNPDRIEIIALARLLADPAGTLGRLSEALRYHFDPALFLDLYDPSVMSRRRRSWLFFHRKSLREAEAVYDELVRSSL